MAKQEYFCPACRHAGAVEHEAHAGIYDVIYLIESDHKQQSPMCYQGTRGMRVRNVEMCSDQEWAQIISGGTVG